MTPTHDVLLATVRAFADRTKAVRVAVVLDRGPDRLAPTIEAEPGGAGGDVVISQGDEQYLVPNADLDGVEPLHVHLPIAVPASALEVNTVTGEVEAPIGLLGAMADGVQALAVAMGGRSVAHAEFGTRSGRVIALAARAGEPVVVTVGDEQFEVPDGA